MPINSHSKDGTLTIQIVDTRLTDESVIKNLQDDLVQLLDKSSEEQVIIDFGDVEFMSSSMLGKLVQIHKKCQGFKVNLKLCSVRPEILEVFKITKLNKLFAIEADEAAARKAFTRRGFFR